MTKAEYAKRESSVCFYWKYADYYNHNGYIPCGECYRCQGQQKADDRLKRWNAATDAGADPNR